MSDTNSALEQMLQMAEAEILQSKKYVKAPPPEVLYHYTNASGLLGIIESSRIWATDYRFLNDSSEIQYAVSLFHKIIEKRLLDTDDDITTEFFERCLEKGIAFDGFPKCHMACFCEKDNLLNQWRVYTSAGGGYAIGFQPKNFRVNDGHEEIVTNNYTILKIEYNEDKQKSLIEEVINLTLTCLNQFTKGQSVKEAEKIIEKCCHFVRVQTAEYLMSFKHPAFAVEEEWRLCHLSGSPYDKHIKYRDGQYGLTPYVNVNLCPKVGENAHKLPITRITHGPGKDPEIIHSILKQMLSSKFYSNVEVSGSKIPVRFKT